jgi:ATP-dependent exoDNAse (exonuclease V) beta subunit
MNKNKVSYNTIKKNTKLSSFKPGLEVKFDEAEHKYTYGDRVLISVTQFLSQYKQKFDEDKWSKYVSKRDKIPVALVKERWHKKRDDACELGTNVHLYAEYLVHTLMDKHFDRPMAINDKAVRMMKQLDKLFLQQTDVKPIASEQMVYDIDCGIAGTIDFVYKDPKGNLYLADWKTNDNIKQSNGYEHLKAPFSFLDDCNYNHYKLQLHLYKILYDRMFNTDIKGLFIIHVKEDNYDAYQINPDKNILELLNQEVDKNRGRSKDTVQ